MVVQLASVCQVFGLLVSQQDSHLFGYSATWTVGWLVGALFDVLVGLVGWLVGHSVPRWFELGR